ncbi:DEAD/DEAH box helicase family protein [Arcanobacterium bovis]|uniref:DEAD/DEAH box helicase n=1 Tax=Arcanobacterium bovis TaxID=2529275 RepID=A0A4Q9V2A5_9ACTO|nr:DEAD/DEAH box helicase family protein [Arcanobacterium bovis]TBW23779.1 DEAD/DEAH box helicase [Arcanobacterium bovis]
MKLKFDENYGYQLDAINTVVDLFDGQPYDSGQLTEALLGLHSLPIVLGQSRLPGADEQFGVNTDSEIQQEIGAIGNNLVLGEATILDNLKRRQEHNGLPESASLVDGLQFDIEMETGTGKTYVYLRTIFELAKRYNFTKFVILVPSVPIREGVNSSIHLMKDHFKKLYPTLNFNHFVYSGKNAEQVQSFATSTAIQIMVMTVDAIKGDAKNRILHQHRDRLNGLRPVDFLRAVKPIVIMDEPQNMESDLSKSSVKELRPAFTLRYSATHKKNRNLVYQLDPVAAHNLELVKGIAIAETLQSGTNTTPYIKLLEVRHGPKKWEAKLELNIRKKDGTVSRSSKWVAQGVDLARATDNDTYSGNWRINEVSIEPPYIELSKHGLLQIGEQIGGSQDAVYREMIRETIREHFRKETMLRPRGIKVLSLFFVDRVASYLGDGSSNEEANGKFVQYFDQIFEEERERNPRVLELLPERPIDYRRAYFSKTKGRYYDPKTGTAKDDDSYDLIMKDKERLLSEEEPVRFIFSHSALREGWDNPNVFQICTLREIGSETERRQTIGRGLRLPVNAAGERVSDRAVAQLTIVADESYKEFANALQNEYEKAGVKIGVVRENEFTDLPWHNGDEVINLGFTRSKEIWNQLKDNKIIDAKGHLTEKFAPEVPDFSLNLSAEFSPIEQLIIERLKDLKIERIVKSTRHRVTRKLNKQIYDSPEFEAFWAAISAKTTYSVRFDSDELIANAIKRIKKIEYIEPLRIQVTKAQLRIERGGAHADETSQRSADLRSSYPLPDIVKQLQEATSLTRKTIVDILIGSGRLNEFIGNPNDFIKLVTEAIQDELAEVVSEGIQYERIGGSVYSLRELQQDGEKEKAYFLDNLYKVKNEQKTDFDYVVFDSDTEKKFAEILDGREDIKLFTKLPPKFKIDTPVGPYNPDWAIVKHVDGEDRIYMVRETKSTANAALLRPKEQAKIDAAKKHFEALGIDYKKSSPEGWNL